MDLCFINEIDSPNRSDLRGVHHEKEKPDAGEEGLC